MHMTKINRLYIINVSYTFRGRQISSSQNHADFAKTFLLCLICVYSMFHVTWTIFKFSRNQLGTVSAFVMISVPWNNQRAHQVISREPEAGDETTVSAVQ